MSQTPGADVPGAAGATQPTGTIRLTIQGSVMTSNMITPTCRINGHPVPTRYGSQDLVVWAGPNHLDMEAQWMRTYGQAALDVNVAPGQVVDVFYAAPLHQFTTGNIGLTKQARPGMGCLWIGIAVAVLFFTLAFVLVLASS